MGNNIFSFCGLNINATLIGYEVRKWFGSNLHISTSMPHPVSHFRIFVQNEKGIETFFEYYAKGERESLTKRDLVGIMSMVFTNAVRGCLTFDEYFLLSPLNMVNPALAKADYKLCVSQRHSINHVFPDFFNNPGKYFENLVDLYQKMDVG